MDQSSHVTKFYDEFYSINLTNNFEPRYIFANKKQLFISYNE